MEGFVLVGRAVSNAPFPFISIGKTAHTRDSAAEIITPAPRSGSQS